MILNNCFSHHVHKLPLSPFPVSHLISSFLLLGLNKSRVLFLRFNVPLSLKLFFLPLHNFISFIIFEHLSETCSFFHLSGKCLLLFFKEFLFNLSHHSLVEVLFLLQLKSLSKVLISELLVSGKLLLIQLIPHLLVFLCFPLVVTRHLLQLKLEVRSFLFRISFSEFLLLTDLPLEISSHFLLLFGESQLLHFPLLLKELSIEFHDGRPLIFLISS